MIESLAILLAIALVWAAWIDLRTRIIPNRLTLAIALVAPLWWGSRHMPIWPDTMIQIGLALLVLLLFAGLFALGAMGADDVKLIAALALWLPPAAFLTMLVAMALIGGGVTLATLAWHRWAKRPGTPEIPYGIAISLAGLWVITNELLTIPAR